MDNRRTRSIYRMWAPVYDLVFRRVTAPPRRVLLEGLRLQPGEWVLLSGVGTGQDLSLIPPEVRVVAGDFSPEMLQRAISRRPDVQFLISDAQALPYADATFDAVILSLVLSVVQNGAQAMQEAWRVLRPGGRVGVFDKFLPEGQTVTAGRRVLGSIIRRLGTDPNRRLGKLTAGLTGVERRVEQPSLLAGRYRLLWLYKTADRPEGVGGT